MISNRFRIMNETFLGHPAEVDIRVAEVGNFSAKAFRAFAQLLSTWSMMHLLNKVAPLVKTARGK